MILRPITTYLDPGFKQWEQETAALPSQEQMKAVVDKLIELNPGFDGKAKDGVGATVRPAIENGVVTGLALFVDQVADISPVRALAGLKQLNCQCSDVGKGILSDLSPLQGMSLTEFNCSWTRVTDLSPLAGMPLTFFACSDTRVADLSPLRGMPLTNLFFINTPVANISPLAGMPLKDLKFYFTDVTSLLPLEGMQLETVSIAPGKITQGMNTLRQMKSLKEISIGLGKGEQFSPAEFWKKYDAGEFGKPGPAAATTPDRKPITTWLDPAFKKWEKEVAALPGEAQIQAVMQKLQELNPEFDGRPAGFHLEPMPRIVNGVVTDLGFVTDHVTNLAPVRALVGLKNLDCRGSGAEKGQLADLSPLAGMQLTGLICGGTQVSDLSPLAGMPLTFMNCGGTPVADLGPLDGMGLTYLHCDVTRVSDLSPLDGMPLKELLCNDTQVTDLSMLKGMNLTTFGFTPRNITKGIKVVRQMKSLTSVGLAHNIKFLPNEFWSKYDAGEFGKPEPAAAATTPDRKPITTWLDPAFKKWEKKAAALPADEQIKAVVKKLVELNPAFDGKEKHAIEGGSVTKLYFDSAEVADLSPIRALTNLGLLVCGGGGTNAGKLADLSPLKGMSLGHLYCGNSQISDLSPLAGMPLVIVECSLTSVSDLKPLEGMKLVSLSCFLTKVSDLSPLRGMPLTSLACWSTSVADLSPLRGMKLTTLNFVWTNVSDSVAH